MVGLFGLGACTTHESMVIPPPPPPIGTITMDPSAAWAGSSVTLHGEAFLRDLTA
jgi:hypothetical protein